MIEIVLILDNIRSALNVGAIMRTAAGLGVSEIYVLGLTPYLRVAGDQRLPHIVKRAERQILKTALGAEKFVNLKPVDNPIELADMLKSQGYQLISIENHTGSQELPKYKTNTKTALILGSEVDGVQPGLIAASDKVLSIPMTEAKESFNVAAAAAMAIYHFKFRA
ncbi:MAG TPA: TrmH family RNA methyltransferase [Candidatus Saccharimonadales bacterium]